MAAVNPRKEIVQVLIQHSDDLFCVSLQSTSAHLVQFEPIRYQNVQLVQEIGAMTSAFKTFFYI